MSIPTPKYTHLSTEDFENIYEPAEDTFLLIDAIEKDLSYIKSISPKTCLEIGSGSGIVITALGTALGDSATYYSVDINPKACEATFKTGIENQVNIQTFCGDLDSALPPQLMGMIDVLLFNPPYVVTPHEEVSSGNLEYTWAGGINGTEVLNRLLPKVGGLLSSKGVFYLVIEKQNNPKDITDFFRHHNFNVECVLARRAGPEHLFIYKFSKD